MTVDFVKGDASGLSIPAHADALAAVGVSFLTDALRQFGVISSDNRVTKIKSFEPCSGGSTGQKLFLSVEYQNPGPELNEDLFVKFSRDFTDPLRDLGRFEMRSEVRLAALSRHPDFPISVPVTYFADYHEETGTGLLISSRVPFGYDGVEAQLQKCADHLLDDSLAYYRTVMRSLARLAAAHKSGLLAAEVEAAFPFDREAAIGADPIPWSKDEIHTLVTRLAEFALLCPQLLPDAVRDPAFIAKFEKDASRVLQEEMPIKRYLHLDPAYIGLCHWNAQLDNAWFWRDSGGELHCGLIDWGRVRQMNFAYALWGCLVGAELWVWQRHLDELLEVFTAELHAHGGPQLDLAQLKLHLYLYAATIGLAGIMIAPERILLRLPEAHNAVGPTDPVFAQSEEARGYLHILTIFLTLWTGTEISMGLERVAGEIAQVT